MKKIINFLFSWVTNCKTCTQALNDCKKRNAWLRTEYDKLVDAREDNAVISDFKGDKNDKV